MSAKLRNYVVDSCSINYDILKRAEDTIAKLR